MKLKTKRKKTRKPALPKKTSRTRKPHDMTLEEWQTALRREYGREQNYQLENIGEETIFSEFLVTNPESQRTYRIAIRGLQPGENYCSCPDFAVNLLGTCKHIEFTLGKLERKPGAKKALREGFTPSYSEVLLRYGKQREIHFKPGRDCPEELKKYASRYFDKEGKLNQEAYFHFQTFLRNATRKGHDLRCYEDALQFIAQIRDDDQRKKRIDQVFPHGFSDPQFQKIVKADLYPYQRKGALFAAKAGRCLIGDDMGLGKTIQAIAAVEILAQVDGVDKILVICPTSLKHQWKQELARFTDRSCEVIEGSKEQRKAAYSHDSFYKITNYDVIHIDQEIIQQWAPDVIVLDEAQRIKNWNTRRAQSVKNIRSKYAFVLTGTPLENRLEELHSIVEYIDCFRLGPLYRYLAEHQHVDEFGKVIGYKNLSQISETLRPILIRRTKDEVLKELPGRIQKHLFVPMTPEQQDHHESNRETVARIVNKWRRIGFLTEQDQRRLRVALQFMRMACNSTFLIDKKTDHGVKADEAVQLFDEILEEPKSKIVVFSQWIGTHQILMNRLGTKPWKYAFFHGSLSSRERGELIQAFREDPDCRLFLSTDAGGVGLNLQNASTVVNMDQPWNPAVLEQRIGRVHRLGQKRSVQVFNFISQGTIEHSILDILKFKKSVFAGVLDGGENEVFLGGTRLNKFMETVGEVSEAISPATPTQDEPSAEERDTAQESETKMEQPVNRQQELWMDILTTGMALFSKLGQALVKTDTKTQTAPLIHKDEKTGETFIKLPLPNPDILNQFFETAKPLLDALTREKQL